MAIYDTFLFADPSERDVLLAKLHIENNIVDHWFVVDTAYSNTGKFKGYHCKKVLNDPAFLPFRERITVVEYADNILETSSGGGRISQSWKKASGFARHQAHYVKKLAKLKSLRKFLAYLYEESYRFESRKYFRAEMFYRDLTRPAILEVIKDNDFLFISDVDEILDGENLECRMRLLNLTSPHIGMPNIMRLLKRKRLWDYHNLDTTSFSYVPLVRGQYLKSNADFKFILMRQTQSALTPFSRLELVHEYSSCFPIEGLVAKYRYHSDLFFTKKEEIELSLRLNKNIGMPNVKPMGWLELVELSEDHQPKYIKENFKALTTNNVAIDYKANRVELFPELFR